MIWSWRIRSNSQTGLGAELLLPAKSAFCFCCLFYFSRQYHHFYHFFFYLILFFSKKLSYGCTVFFLYGFGTCQFFFFFFFCKESWPQHQQREDRNYRLNNGAEYYQHTPNPIDNEELPYTDRFTYLGSIISGDGRTELDIHSRFNKTRNSLNTMNKVWRSSNYSTRTKLKLYHSCVLKNRRSIYHNSPYFTPGAFGVCYTSSGLI